NQSSAPVEGNGQVLAWVTTDIDGEARAMPRDIGADDGSFLSNTAPGNVAIVSPLNGEVDVLGSTTLNWTFGENTTDCDVYLSTNQTLVGNLDPTALVVEGQNVTSYDPPGNLNQGIWYYWKVVARNAATSETNAGPVWSFRTYIPPLSGTMTIGGVSPNFATFADAINAMVNAGVGAGGVTFNVRPGTYAERITVPSIPSITETSPVVFQREAGAVTVSGLGTSATNDAMIWLNGCDYVTFDGINVLDPGTSSTDYVEYGYYVTPFGSSSTDGANYNTVKNAMIQMHKVNTSSYGVRQYYVTTPTAQSGANSYNRYLNLKVTDTYYGVYLYSSSSTSFYDMNNEVGSNSSSLTDPNRFVIGSGGGEDIGNYGLYLYYGSNYNVHNIDVRGVSTASTSGTLYSMYVYYTRGTSTVNGCRVYEMSNSAGGINSTVYHRGMYLYPQSGHTLDVYNNMVYGFTHPRTTETTTQYVTPIYSGNSGILNFHHNTVAIGTGVGTGPSSSCWYIAGGAVTANNNIFYNNTPAQTTAKHYGIYRSSATSFTSNYNDIFVQNANGFTGYYAGDMTDMAAWRTASGQDANSIADNPMFVNETTNPHIGIASNSMVESAGTPLASITTDIEGDARNATTPDIGADEGVFNDPFSPSDATLTNVTTTSMVLGWQDNTTDELGFPVYMSTNGTDFTLYATTVPNVVSLPIGGLNIGTHYWFRVYAQLPGGPSAGYASANAWTLVYGANVGSGITMSASLVDPGYTTAVVNSITDNTGNPVGTYYRVLELNSGNYITNTGGLGVTPRTALGANWTAYNLTGLPLGASLNFVPIACNGGGVEATPAGQAFPLQLNNYAQSGGPDGGGYYFRTSNAGATYDWVDISATGTLVPFPSYDDNYAQVSLGTFTFPYYGTTVSGVLTVITNGNVQIGASTASSLTNYALPTTNLNAGALSLLWDDLIYTTGWGTTTWVKYQNINDQMFVITYNGYRYNVTTNTFLAQIVIYSDGRIKFQYNNAPNPAAFTSTIGIQGAQTGTLFTQYAVTDIGWPGNNFAIEFSQGVPPTTPSNPTPADLATGVALTPTLGWTSNGTTYDVYFGTDNPPATAVSMGQAGSTYSVVAPLAQNTLYYWKVVAHNATGEAPGAVWSFTTASAPSAPVVSLTYSGGNANLSWPASTGTVTGYRIYRYATGYFTPPATGTLLATNDAATLTYSDLGVNGQYYYRVTAFNAAATASAPRSNESAVLVPRFISNDPAYGTPWPRALGVNRDAAKTVK
ncbi:MAG: fibronectin type III domain-containing protein, partial [bacterium]|nr:fibronectin type III domain-containing protein [bacterium]